MVCNLHISLTRPFFLRAHQREEMQMSKAKHEERDEDVEAWQPRTTRSMDERERARRGGTSEGTTYGWIDSDIHRAAQIHDCLTVITTLGYQQ